MTPVAEPTGDICAQINAMLDPEHPKLAVFVVPSNVSVIPRVLHPDNICIVHRDDGTLVTADKERADLYRQHGPVDALMAWILGYPQDKTEAVAACGGNPLLARAVQARDAAGNVITEAFVAPGLVSHTSRALSDHVPSGGVVVVLPAAESIIRRIDRCRRGVA